MKRRVPRHCLGCGLLGLATAVAVAWALSLREQLSPKRPDRIAVGTAVVDGVIVEAAVKRQPGLTHEAWKLVETSGPGLYKDYTRALAHKFVTTAEWESRRRFGFQAVLNWATFNEIINLPPGFSNPRETALESADAMASRGSPVRPDQIAYVATYYRRLTTGWPLAALRHTERLDEVGVALDSEGVPTASQWEPSSGGAIELSWMRSVAPRAALAPAPPPLPALLPLEPRPGLVVNTALFALLWFLLLRLPHSIRSARRRRRGLCAECGYDLGGLAAQGKCPECGGATGNGDAAMGHASPPPDSPLPAAHSARTRWRSRSGSGLGDSGRPAAALEAPFHHPVQTVRIGAMKRITDAIFADGVFEPAGPSNLREQQRVQSPSIATALVQGITASIALTIAGCASMSPSVNAKSDDVATTPEPSVPARGIELLGSLHGAVPVSVPTTRRTISGAWPGRPDLPIFLESVPESDRALVMRTAEAEVLKYPRSAFSDQMVVYVASRFQVGELTGLGTTWPRGAIVALPDQSTPEARAWVLGWAIHDQMTNWLVRAESRHLPLNEWAALLPSDFAYGTGNTSEAEEDFETLEHGFLSLSSQADFGADFRSYATSMFMNESQFWRAFERFEVVRGKGRLVIDFFHELHPGFTEDYFRNLPDPERPLAAVSQAGESRTTIDSLPINFDVSSVTEIPGVPVTGVQPVPEAMRETWEKLLRQELQKYPKEVLSDRLTVYPCSVLLLSGVRVGGTFWERGILVAGERPDDPLVGLGIAHSLHHELTTWIGFTNWSSFDAERWEACLPGGFKYSGDPVQGIKNRETGSSYIDPELLESGFLNRYSQTSFQNDFAEIGAELFLNRPRFWEAVESHERLRLKVALIVEFLESVDSRLNENYFRNLR